MIERLRRFPGRAAFVARPALCVAAVMIAFESGETMPYRFFLEPTFFVFAGLALASHRPGPAASGSQGGEARRPIGETIGAS